MKNILIIVVLLIIIGAGAWYFLFQETSDISLDGNTAGVNTGEPVAVVNGEEVSGQALAALETQIATSQGQTVASLDSEARAQLQTQAMDALIGQVLLRQKVQSSGITITQEKLASEMELIRARFATEEEYQATLSAEGLDEEGLQTRIGLELITQSYLEQELGLNSVTASEAEVQEAYTQIDAQGQELPALEEIRADLETFVIQQKQQALLDAHIQELRADADVEILI
ncbi:MAG: SurA N-terminal domain-containing protein [bacterium]|nr:SurA N-terminal domain-containing protein [bacterium]